MDIFEFARDEEQRKEKIKEAKRQGAEKLRREMEKQKLYLETRNFFEAPTEDILREENKIAAELNRERDAYEDRHGRGSDERYPGYVWVYGVLVKAG